jgi:hypothetical protein
METYTFELWDKESRSIVGSFSSEAEVLAAVREALACHGSAYAETFAVIREDARGRSKLLGEGSDLVELARRSATVPELNRMP